MLKHIPKLRQERQKLIDELRSITATIEAREDKNMTEQEDKRWKELQSLIDQSAEVIKRAEYENQLEMERSSKEADEQEKVTGEKRFNSFGEFLSSVIRTGQGAKRDDRLVESRAVSGMNEGIPSDGGFLVQTDQAAGLITKMHEESILASRCRKIPISANSNGTTLNSVDETSRATGSRWGGIQVFWSNEGDTAAGSKPKFRQMELKLKKLLGFCYLTDELIQDAIALESVAAQAFAEEFAWVVDDAILNGNGVGKPLGILNSPALITVNKEGAQASDTINYENITKMWERLYARSRANSVWFINQDCERQLGFLALVIGSGGIPVFMPAGGISGSPYSTLYGRPIVPLEQCKTLGDVGDIVLADMNQYLLINKSNMQQTSSIHVRFMNDEQVLRFTYRVDGQPLWNAPLMPANGTNTLSPFVALQAR
jgi:HK97 family phage major capsid protein